MTEPQRTAYLKDELRNLLTALRVTVAAAAGNVEYEAGYTDALHAMAVALGLTTAPQPGGYRLIDSEVNHVKSIR